MKKLNKLGLLIVPLILLTVGETLQAAQINGGIAVGGSTNSQGFTSSSLTLTGESFVESSLGDLSTADLGSFPVIDSSTISGLSTTAASESINDFFEFSSPGILSSTGTTPADRFVFDLSSLTEAAYFSPALGADFSGSGTLVDTTGQLQSALANFSLSFSGSNSYSFSLSTEDAPEPSSWTMMAGSLLLLALGARFVKRNRFEC